MDADSRIEIDGFPVDDDRYGVYFCKRSESSTEVCRT